MAQTIVKMRLGIKSSDPPNPSIRTKGVNQMPLMENPRQVKWQSFGPWDDCRADEELCCRDGEIPERVIHVAS